MAVGTLAAAQGVKLWSWLVVDWHGLEFHFSSVLTPTLLAAVMRRA